MDNAIKYQFGAIQAAAGDINASSGRINNLLDTLKSQIQPMVATWEGESASAYQAAQAQWDRAQHHLGHDFAHRAGRQRSHERRQPHGCCQLELMPLDRSLTSHTEHRHSSH